MSRRPHSVPEDPTTTPLYNRLVDALQGSSQAKVPKMDAQSVQRCDASHKNNRFNKYEELWTSKEFSDVTIQCSGQGEEIQVHKLVLMGSSPIIGLDPVNSPVFAAMFKSGLQESKTNVINIPDFTKAALEIVFEFMYTGCVDLEIVSDNREKMMSVLRAADKYQIDDLKSDIFSFFLRGMAISTVGKIVVLAGEYNASKTIKSRIQEFLHQNWKQVSKDTDVRELMKTHGMIFGQISYGDFA